MHILIDDKIPYIQGEAERLGTTTYKNGGSITAEDVREADALIIRTRTCCNRELLADSKVKFIATATIGFDHIDTQYLQEAGIEWTNCPGCNASSVGQYVANSLLLLEEAGHISTRNCTVGIIGVGHVGTQVEAAVKRLGCRVLRYDPPRAAAEGNEGFATMEDLLTEADVLTFHTPLTRSGAYPTYHMADEAFFKRLTRQPVLINSARGEVVSNAALKQALQEGSIRAAVIDTWENEPAIDRELLDKVFLGTPHIAGYSADGKACGTRMALEAVARHFGMTDLTFDIQAPTFSEDSYYHSADRGIRPADSPLRLYNPQRDSENLKQHPEQFEYLRGNYPLRREK